MRECAPPLDLPEVMRIDVERGQRAQRGVTIRLGADRIRLAEEDERLVGNVCAEIEQ